MKTIVVIDDEFGLVDVLAASLSDAGYRVVTATNGVQGLERIAEHAPDLVLLDFMMPLLDGPGVLRAMAADPTMAGIPVVLMTSMTRAFVESRASGYAAFLRKPFEYGALMDAIDRALAATS